jgi:FkbM family methyltransferase
MFSQYSQNDEEAFLVHHFAGKTGKLLDIGAFDGVGMSNTRRLIELGWAGVLVEAHWGNFTTLCQNHKGFEERVTLVCAALAPKAGLRKLWVDLHANRAWSTTLSDDLKNIGSIMVPSSLVTMVSCITMADLWPLGPYDLISMDAEWEDFEILKSQPQEAWRQVPMLCVETRHPTERAAVKQFMQTIGFAIVHETKENMICQRQ